MKLAEEARQYEPKETKNIADLDVVSIDIDVYEVTANEGTAEEFKYKACKIDNVEHRVPLTVLKQLKTFLEEKPHMKTFKVKKQGEGLNTTYTVIPLD